MAPEIKTEIQGGLVRRHYSSHIDYSRESNVYAKLKGTGLVAEITAQYDGYIERVFVEGPSFEELYEKYETELPKLASLYEELCSWYTAYREATKLILGEAAPEKFILTDKGFVYVDFENVRPGFPEQDIAALVRWMFSKDGGRNAAKLFICVCTSKLDLHPERLEKYLTAELGGEEGGEEWIRFLTSAGIVVSDGSAPIEAATAFLSAAPERYIAVCGSAAASCPGFEIVRSANLRDAVSVIVRKTSQVYLTLQFCGSSAEPAAPVCISKSRAMELLLNASEDADISELFKNGGKE